MPVDAERAQENLDSLRQIAPDSGLTAHLGFLRDIRNGNFQRALSASETRNSFSSQELPFLLDRGMIFLQQDERLAAESSIRAAMVHATFFDFQRLGAVDALSRLLVSSGRSKEATAVDVTVHEGAPASAQLHANHAIAPEHSGNGAEAKSALLSALAVSPDDPVALYLVPHDSGSERRMEHGLLLIGEHSNECWAVTLMADRYTIDGEERNYVVVASRFASRHHCELACMEGRRVLNDLNTRNGALVNGEKQRTVVLKDGDLIELCDTKLCLYSSSLKSLARSPTGS